MRECWHVHCGQISNGMRFYTQYDSSSAKEAVLFQVSVGSMHDPPHKRGMAHLVEHCFTESLRRQQEYVDFKIRHFGSPYRGLTYETQKSLTLFGYEYPMKKTINRKLLSLVFQEIQNPRITSDILNDEKAVVREEYFSEEADKPGQVVEQVLHELIIPYHHPTRHSVLGKISDIETVSLRDVRDFMTRYYTPWNIFSIYLGPRHQEVKRILEDCCGQWKVEKSIQQSTYSELRQKRTFPRIQLPYIKRKKIKKTGLKQYYAGVGFPVSTYGSDDQEVLELLTHILYDRMMTHLRRNNHSLRGCTYSSDVFLRQNYCYGLFIFQFHGEDIFFIQKGIDLFLKECHDLATHCINKDEWQRRVAYYYESEFLESFARDQTSLIDLISTAVANGDTRLRRLHAKGDQIKKLGSRSGRQIIREVAKKYITGNYAQIIISPS